MAFQLALFDLLLFTKCRYSVQLADSPSRLSAGVSLATGPTPLVQGMLLRTVTVTPLAVSETGRSDDHTQNCRKSKRSHLRSTATLAPLWLPVKPTMNADVLLLALGVTLKLNMTHSEELTEIFLLSRIRASVLSRLSPLVPGTVVVVVLSRLYMVADIYIVDSVHAAMHGDSALSGIHSEILHGSRLAGATLTSQLQQGSLRNPKLPLRSTSTM